jgi:hypothetical protein
MDTVNSLRDGVRVDLDVVEPTRQISSNPDATAKQIEQDGIDMKYKIQLEKHLERVQALEHNFHAAYSLIFDNHCTRLMQIRLEEHPDFDSKIKNDPIVLLETIKTLIHQPVRAQYPYVTFTETMRAFLWIKQKEDEELSDYTKRFKQQVDILKRHTGSKMLHYFIENTQEYKKLSSSTMQTDLKDSSFEAWCAYHYMRTVDQSKYGTVLEGLANQYSLGNNQYPTTMTAAIDVIANHKLDEKYHQQQKQKKAQKQQQQSKQANAKTTQDFMKQMTFAQQGQKPICFKCGKEGHKAPDCRADIPNGQWAMNKAMSTYVQTETDEDDQSHDSPSSDNRRSESHHNSNDSQADSNNQRTGGRSSRDSGNQRSGGRNFSQRRTSSTGWCGLQGFHNKKVTFQDDSPEFDIFSGLDLTQDILLDTGSNIKDGTFMNPDLVNNIGPASKPLIMDTNAGQKPLTMEGTVPKYGKVYFDPQLRANIFSFGPTQRKYRVTYDNAIEDAFTVHTPDGPIKFANVDDLYLYRPHSKTSQSNYAHKVTPASEDYSFLVNTLEENLKGYSERQIKAAKKARDLYHNAGAPGIEELKALLRMQHIKSCPVTAEDLQNAEDIYGMDIHHLRGTTTRRTPRRIQTSKIWIPREIKNRHQDLTWCIDVLHVNGIPFLSGIVLDLRYRSVVPLPNRSAQSFFDAIKVVHREVTNAGYSIKTVRCDPEFKPIMDDVKDVLKIDMDYVATKNHVPEAERNNRTIAERVRTAYHRLPYANIPKLMIQELVIDQTRKLNLFPARGGVSPYYSPERLIGGDTVDFERDLKYAFGSYVQANNEPTITNSLAPRTLDCIYLRTLPNGGHKLMNLATGLAIVRPRIWPIPVTKLVIRSVERMADEQGIKSLKIQNRNLSKLYPVDWIAGVDYDKDAMDSDPPPSMWDITPYEEKLDTDLDAELDDEDFYDPIEQDEIDDILAESNDYQDNPPNGDDNSQDDAPEDGGSQPDQDDDTDPEDGQSDDEPDDKERRYPRRERREREVLTYPVLGEQEFQTETPLETKHNLHGTTYLDPDWDEEYDPSYAPVMAQFINEIRTGYTDTSSGICHGPQYILQKGLKVFGEEGKQAASKEVKQLHDRVAFEPIDVSQLTAQEKQRACEALMFLTEKRDGTKKGRMVYNGAPSREWTGKDDAKSPTASNESIMITAVIDAVEQRDIMSADVPNAFIQTHLPPTPKGVNRVVMKITGSLVDLLVEIAPEVYGPHVVYQNGRRVLYVLVLKALYGMLVASLLWYKQFRKDLEEYGFDFNPYDPCVANKFVNGKQHTIRFHVDDLMASHVDPKVNDDLHKWLNKMYGTYGEVKCTRGKVHDYLGMTFDLSLTGVCQVDMSDYINSMCDDFITDTGKELGKAKCPAPADLLDRGKGDPLEPRLADLFHTYVMKGMYACKRARPDIHPAVAILCTRVRDPNTDDWRKLLQLMNYLNATRDDKLYLSADDLSVVKWSVDASYAVHPDFKSHTGATMSMGRGAITSTSRKQKLNTTSSTEAELVGAHDLLPQILWTRLFMEAQGYPLKQNILLQDNKSTILLESNGKRSSSNRTRHFNIRYFFLTDQIEKGTVEVNYCPTEEMSADFMTKPLQGHLFETHKRSIMGTPPGKAVAPQECVDRYPYM